MEKLIEINYQSIRAACASYEDDIKAGKKVDDVLGGRRVRYVDQDGHFGYARFGEFYFDWGAMMLYPKDLEYAVRHGAGVSDDPSRGAVPVMYAGVESDYKDDGGRTVFTGDIVTVVRNGVEHGPRMLRWCPYHAFPTLMDADDEAYIRPGDQVRVEGNVFYDIWPGHVNEHYDYRFFFAHGGILPFFPETPDGRGRKALERELEKARRAPYFGDEPSPRDRYNQMHEYGNELYLTRDTKLFSFSRGIQLDGGEKRVSLICDYIPGWVGTRDCETVYLDEKYPDWKMLKEKVNSILDTAQKTLDPVVVMDWRKSIKSKELSDALGDLFRPVYERPLFHICLPARLLCRFMAEYRVKKIQG